jgi:glycosyltransferase involved in cell wall biosynthesis
MPRVTVVLPVYNQEKYVQKTLDALFDQDYPDYQIIAVDDGSLDASLEILKRNSHRIRVIESRHQGPAASRNTAIQAADSEFIAFMDADDLCSGERLRLSVEKFETEAVGLVASALGFVDFSGEPLPGLWTCPPEGPNDYWGALLERNWIGTPSVMVRRTVLDAAGWFDEDFTHAEDYDLWLRIGEEHPIGFLDMPLIQCRRHSMNTSLDIATHQHFERIALQKIDRRRARAAFNRLHSTADRRLEAWIWFLLRSGDARFLEETQLAIARFPESDSVRFALGVFQYDAGWYRDATMTFAVLKARDTASLHNVGVLMSLCGDTDAACLYLETALQRRPDYYDARHNLDAIKKGERLRLTRRPFRSQPVAMIGH